MRKYISKGLYKSRIIWPFYYKIQLKFSICFIFIFLHNNRCEWEFFFFILNKVRLISFTARLYNFSYQPITHKAGLIPVAGQGDWCSVICFVYAIWLIGNNSYVNLSVSIFYHVLFLSLIIYHDCNCFVFLWTISCISSLFWNIQPVFSHDPCILPPSYQRKHLNKSRPSQKLNLLKFSP